MKPTILNQGVAIGRIYIYRSVDISPESMPISDPETELRRLDRAVSEAVSDRRTLARDASALHDDSSAGIFETHILILSDENILDDCRRMITEDHVSAEYAVSAVFEKKAGALAMSGDETLRARTSDIYDLRNSLLHIISGQKEDDGISISSGPFILEAVDLTPSEAARLARVSVAGVILRDSSPLSHASIIIRELGIPAITGYTGISAQDDGHIAILDADECTVITNPDEESLREYAERESTRGMKEFDLFPDTREAAHDPGSMQLYANISSPEETARAIMYGAEGIGLYRTEYMYLNADSEPAEEEQFEAYRSVLESMQGRPVIIRTCDIGADKLPEYMRGEVRQTSDPSMGIRGIRYSLTHPDVFVRQLRALYRASAYGDLGVMFPMVSTVSEVREALSIAEDCRLSTGADPIRIGVMIETPAAALVADELAEISDFFSIGTNDLAQYTYALDRQSADMILPEDRDPTGSRRALLRLIEMTADAARSRGIPVGICGEIATKPELTEVFLRMGISYLSMSASNIPIIRRNP